jgi:hypothetical protein
MMPRFSPCRGLLIIALIIAAGTVSCSAPAQQSTPLQPAQPSIVATTTPDPSPTPTACIPRYASPEVVLEYEAPASFVDWALADFNTDGLPDILVARGEWQSPKDFPVDIFKNDGNGGFSNATQEIIPETIPRTQHPREIVLADFNGDGRLDVYIADHGNDQAPYPGYQNSLILSAPGGGLVDATGNLPQQSDFTHSAATADIDNDGDIDIYAGNIYGGNRIPPQILVNDGQARFSVARGLLPAAQADMNRNKYTTSLFADINNDGSPDLILGADDYTQSSAVLLNDGTGRFSILPNAMPQKPNAATDIALDIAATDLNADGHLDLLIAWTKGDPSYQGRYIQVLMNDGDATFTDETQARLPSQGFEDTNWWFKFIEITDADEDGDSDILTHAAMDQIIYANDGTGHFVISNSLIPIPPISTYALSDLDGDGHKDFVAFVPGPSERAETLSVGRRIVCP